MKTVGDPRVLQSLLERLGTVRPDSLRRWGTLTPHEMLCHLGDASDMVLGARPRKTPVRDRSRPLLRWLGLWTPIPWPHGRPTNPVLNPRVEGTRPSVFEQDLTRVIIGVKQIAAAPARLLDSHTRTVWRHVPPRLAAVGVPPCRSSPPAVRGVTDERAARQAGLAGDWVRVRVSRVEPTSLRRRTGPRGRPTRGARGSLRRAGCSATHRRCPRYLGVGASLSRHLSTGLRRLGGDGASCRPRTTGLRCQKSLARTGTIPSGCCAS